MSTMNLDKLAYRACKHERITRDEPSGGEIAKMRRLLEWFLRDITSKVAVIVEPKSMDSMVAIFNEVYSEEWDRAADAHPDRKPASDGSADDVATRAAIKAMLAYWEAMA